MAKKGPQYLTCNERQSNCEDSVSKRAQPRKGCPTCEYTIQRKIFLEKLDHDLKYLKRGTRPGARKWPSSYLLKIVSEIGGFANSLEGIDPTWSVVTTNLVSVYRNEKAIKDAIDTHVPDDDIPKGPMLVDKD